MGGWVLVDVLQPARHCSVFLPRCKYSNYFPVFNKAARGSQKIRPNPR
jgi:hypothetical protein